MQINFQILPQLKTRERITINMSTGGIPGPLEILSHK